MFVCIAGGASQDPRDNCSRRCIRGGTRHRFLPIVRPPCGDPIPLHINVTRVCVCVCVCARLCAHVCLCACVPVCACVAVLPRATACLPWRTCGKPRRCSTQPWRTPIALAPTRAGTRLSPSPWAGWPAPDRLMRLPLHHLPLPLPLHLPLPLPVQLQPRRLARAARAVAVAARQRRHHGCGQGWELPSPRRRLAF